VLVATTKPGVRIFELGQPASLGLQNLAESGDTSELSTTLQADSAVLDVTTGTAVAPGASETITVETRDDFDHVIVASMLIPTNAGFFALNDVRGPEGNGTITLYSEAYDAGSKPDDELCAHIPGPAGVCGGTGFVAESTDCSNSPGCIGYVFVHRGIHGIGDLEASKYDWRNPVAQIVISRVP
jgi:Spondin_N